MKIKKKKFNLLETFLPEKKVERKRIEVNLLTKFSRSRIKIQILDRILYRFVIRERESRESLTNKIRHV